MMLVGHCRNCGKELYVTSSGKMNIFCDRQCQLEYGAKRKQEKAAEAAERARLRETLVPEKQCRKCKYGFDYGGRYGCGYVYVKDQSRTSLHPEGLSGDCKEYTPKKWRRKGRGITIR